ncbi:MAG TPA: cysteine--tRNA ligase [Smithellaceae bacterium]|nr:cysteine--tRNA ligase [Smithellaceae bacterium]HPM70047.1 cysteine--tRNA ligase [Smithellaceae bacterium]HPW22709.1 cysteine--tRNA ligase [Smithellaceae bacterium]HQB91943.1 cysteine--tRNA ligase [Smithellaceae bacterium]
MSQKIYNSATRRKEIFKTIQEGKVGIYVCGITAYDICHIGHARSAVFFDVVVRHLRSRGYHVTYVKNFTDIDDKIIERAKKEDLRIGEISERYIALHNEDMASLNVQPPTLTPKATEHIQDMIELISILMGKGYAYCVQGNVYFSVEKFSLYGIQSGRNLEEMVAGARVDVNEEKNNPLDFALWKVSKPGEPSWESPWGKGRPGWHIECSAMSRRYLGDTFDIHGGGEDLIFPHHENEIAQSQAATGKPPANYWMHNGFVRVNAEKMSKSRGNYFSIREILKAHHPEVVRLFILQSHYRSPVDFSEKSLTEARLSLVRCYTALKAQKEIKATLPVVDTGSSQNMSAKAKKIIQSLQELGNKFGDALDDDFNTAKALGYVFESVRLLNNYFIAEKNASPEDKANVLKTSNELFAYFGSILGIFQEDPSNFFIFDKEKESFKRGLSIEKIEKLIEDRKAARMAKNWAKADEIRKQLLNMGVVLKDIDNTTSWIIE